MKALESLQTRIQRLQVRADAIVAKRASEGLTRIRSLMQKHGLTAADVDAYVGGRKRRQADATSHAGNGKSKTAVKTKGKLPPKYRNPKTGETWSGHARPPSWIASVKDRSKFLIASNAAGARAAGKSKAAVRPVRKSAVETKGKLPPKYRDPKTGATWSGHARPPSWIAGVKDRSKFLI